MIDTYGLAQQLFGSKRAEDANGDSSKTASTTATALKASSGGSVLVSFGGASTTADGTEGVLVPTTVDVREGDTVQVTLTGDTVQSPVVIGVIGGGDRTKQTVDKAQTDADAAKAETKDLVTLRIDSSRGTVFKNSGVSTVLTVRCYKRGEEITTLTALRNAMGDQTARIRWYVLRDGDTDWVSLADSDEKLSEDGFALTLNPSDIDIKCTFKAEVVTD